MNTNTDNVAPPPSTHTKTHTNILTHALILTNFSTTFKKNKQNQCDQYFARYKTKNISVKETSLGGGAGLVGGIRYFYNIT